MYIGSSVLGNNYNYKFRSNTESFELTYAGNLYNCTNHFKFQSVISDDLKIIKIQLQIHQTFY